MNDQIYMLVLRLLHICFGIFWAGSILYFALFIIPALKASGPEGVKFMQNLGKTGYPVAVMFSAIISIVAGILLIGKLSGGFQVEWFSSWYARILTCGGGVAIIAFIIGFTVNRPAASQINKISQAVAKQGSPPSAEQMEKLMALRKRIFTGTNYIAVLIAIVVITMSIFRYVS